jgi:hypothetical protein
MHMDDFIGRRLGQYEITSLLGKGGMAVVYRARQTSIGRDDKASSPVPYIRNALHYRAAESFRHQRKPSEQVRSVDDLAPQMAEAEHLMHAGDYDTTTERLLTFGDSYLNI